MCADVASAASFSADEPFAAINEVILAAMPLRIPIASATCPHPLGGFAV